MISKLITHNKIVGVKQVRKALKNEEIQAVYIAEDAEKQITDEIAQICNNKDVQVVYVDNMKKLGNVCGIDVNAAVAALIK
jgi:large subunit ribosomal protein L7A